MGGGTSLNEPPQWRGGFRGAGAFLLAKTHEAMVKSWGMYPAFLAI